MNKSYTNISNIHINDKELVRLELYILSIDYSKEGLSYFTKVLIKNNNEIKVDIKKLQLIFNSKKKRKKIDIKNREMAELPSVFSLLIYLLIISICLFLCLL